MRCPWDKQLVGMRLTLPKGQDVILQLWLSPGSLTPSPGSPLLLSGLGHKCAVENMIKREHR